MKMVHATGKNVASVEQMPIVLTSSVVSELN
jgi:hypothetical protein